MRAVFGGLGRIVLFVTIIGFLVVPQAVPWADVPQGTWLIDGRAVLQIADCDGLACGRIVWLLKWQGSPGQLRRDEFNPDPALRQRELCGLTVLWGLHPVGPDRLEGGWFYDPDGGKTYRVSAQIKSADVLIVRIYLGIPFFGRTKTLLRVPHGTSEGWC